MNFESANLSDPIRKALVGWTIEDVGSTPLRYEGGFTLKLSKGELRRTVTLGYHTEYGIDVHEIEETISQEFLDTTKKMMDEHSETLDALAKGPPCGSPSCYECNPDEEEE